MSAPVGRLVFAANASAAPIFSPWGAVPISTPCEQLWTETRAVRWLNASLPLPPAPLDGTVVDVTRFPYDYLGENGCDGAGYGCWFFLTPGFGARIRLGRVLELEDKRALWAWIARSVSRPYALWFTRRCAAHPTCASWVHSDTGACAAAAVHGVDTVVVGRADADTLAPEVIVCSGACARAVSCDECPAVEYAPECVCTRGFGVSNCNNGSRPPLARCDGDGGGSAARRVLRHKLRELLWVLLLALVGLVGLGAALRCGCCVAVRCRRCRRRRPARSLLPRDGE